MAISNFLLNRALETREVNPNDIVVDYGIQMRENVNAEVVEEYAGVFADAGEWGTFPSLIVFEDAEGRMLLADGFHRLAAWKQSGVKGLIPAHIKAGGYREARFHAIGANRDHGLRRSNADKHKAVMALLHDDEWSRWSDRQLAETAGVSHNFVNVLRRSLSSDDSDKSAPTQRQYVDRHGNVSTMTLPERKPKRSGPAANLQPGEVRTVVVPPHIRTYIAPEAPEEQQDTSTVPLPADWDWDEAISEIRKAQDRLQAIARAKGFSIMNLNWDPKLTAGSWYVEAIDDVGSISAYSSSLGQAIRQLYGRKGE